MPVKVTCNPADLEDISEAAEELDLVIDLDWRMKPGLVRLEVFDEPGPNVLSFSRGYERWRKRWH